MSGPHVSFRMVSVNSNRGISLLETVVVVAIISILAVLIAPGFQHIKARANASKCVGNLRQIHVACLSFVSDNDNYLPGAAGNGKYLYRDLSPYLDVSKNLDDASTCPLFMCPERPLKKLIQMQAQGTAGSLEYGGYLGNPLVIGVPANGYPLVRLSSIAQPAKTWMIGDGAGFAATYPNLEATMYRFGFDHEKKVQATFVDGHIEQLSYDALLNNTNNVWGL